MAAADGYAQASGRVGVVNVHMAPGVANGLSILHNAARAKSPLLVTAGQQDTRFLAPRDVVVVDESATSLPYVLRYLPMATLGSFFSGKTGKGDVMAERNVGRGLVPRRFDDRNGGGRAPALRERT